MIPKYGINRNDEKYLDFSEIVLVCLLNNRSSTEINKSFYLSFIFGAWFNCYYCWYHYINIISYQQTHKRQFRKKNCNLLIGAYIFMSCYCSLCEHYGCHSFSFSLSETKLIDSYFRIFLFYAFPVLIFSLNRFDFLKLCII